MEATESNFWQEVDNDKSYARLTMAVRFSDVDRLNIFIAVCDQPTVQNEIIDSYTIQLQPEFHCYQLKVSSDNISTKKLLFELIDQEPTILQPSTRTVVSVTGAADLTASSNSVTLRKRYGREDIIRTDQEMFFSSLQWTREGLREFQFPLVIWVTKVLYDRMVHEAPDFWSWRKGVFFFKSDSSYKQYDPPITQIVRGDIVQCIGSNGSIVGNYVCSAKNDVVSQSNQIQILDELQGLIAKSVARDPHHRGLAILYSDVADIYAAMGDREKWLEYWKKSYAIRQESDRST
jgi:hypothetical protein